MLSTHKVRYNVEFRASAQYRPYEFPVTDHLSFAVDDLFY